MSYINEEYTNFNHPSSGLAIYNSGYQISGGGHFNGPVTHLHYVMSYVVKGKGKYFVNDRWYELNEGDGYLICPGVVTSYCADEEDPWEYYWVGFNGVDAKKLLKCAGMDEENVTFHYSTDDRMKQLMSDIFYTSRKYSFRDLAMLGYLYLIFSCLINQPDKKAHYVQQKYIDQAIVFIENNYMKNINVSSIAHHIGIERSYLYRIFLKHGNVSIGEYIQRYRIDKSKELLLQEGLSVKDVANLLGFDDASYFSKTFKRVCKETPMQYKEFIITHSMQDINFKLK